MAANYTKHDERRAATLRLIQEWGLHSYPMFEVVCCVCAEPTTIEVNKYPDVRFYCEADLPADPI
jgi:hypothetical protein